MSFQFVHINSYSRTLSKKAKHSKWNAADVVAEATRDESAIPHIDNPQAPIHLYGDPIEDLLGTLDAWAEGTKDASGRATRKDAVCLLAGVFSMPADTPPEQWEKVKNDAITWAKEKYGDRLKTVLEHVDEDHPHCHFYVVPRPGEAFESVHEGRAAVKDFVALGGDKRKTNDVYRGAMRGFQDGYYEAVGAPNGLTRIGPGKRRLSRDAWRMEQQQAEAIAAQLAKAQRLEEEATATVSRVKGQAAQFTAKVKDEAKAIKDKALAEADSVTRKAEAKGFAQGLARFGELPWVQKTSRFLSGVTKERDSLLVERDSLKSALDSTVAEHATLKNKAKGWFLAAKELVTLKPKLEQAEGDVAHLKILNRELRNVEAEKAELTSELYEAKSRIKDLKTWVDTLTHTETPEEPVQQKAPKRGLDHDSVTLGL